MADMVRLWNVQKGLVEEVEPEKVSELVGSKTHAFYKGVNIPVVDTDTGEQITLPSEKAGEAFRAGFQYATPSILQAISDHNLALEKENIKRETMGDIVGQTAALAQGIARGATFGLSDVAQIGAQELLGGAGAETQEMLNALQEVSPIASTGGQIGGMLLTGKPVTTAAAPTAEAAGMVAKALAPVGKTISEKVARSATQGMLEGAAYGFGEGVSEAALGKPEDVAENLLRGVKEGVFWGGVTGGGLPLVAEAVKATTKGGMAATRWGIGKMAPKGEAAQAYKDLAADPLERAILQDLGGEAGLRQAQAETDTVTKEAQKVLDDYQKGVKVLMDAADRDLKVVDRNLKKMSSTEKSLLLETLEAQKAQWRAETEAMLATLPAQQASRPAVYNEMKQAVLADAKKRGVDAESLFVAVEKRLEEQNIIPNLSQADNAKAIWEVRKALSKPASYGTTVPGETQKAFRELRSISDDFLKGGKAEPETKALFSKQDPLFANMDRLDRVSSRIDSAKSFQFNKAAQALMEVDPNSPVIEALKKYRGTQKQIMDNAAARETVKTMLFNIFKTVDAPSVDKLTKGFEGVIDIMGDKGGEAFLQAMTRLRTNQGAAEKVAPILADTTLSSMDKAILIQRELGIKVPDDIINKVAKHQKTYEKLLKVQEASQRVPGWGLQEAALGSAGWSVGGPIGAAAAAGLSRSLQTPISRLNFLTKAEKIQAQTNEWVSKAADWLTGKTGRIAGAAAARQKEPVEPLKIAKKDYLKVYDTYSAFSDPFQAAEIAGNMAKEFSDSPQVQQAYADHYARVGQLIAAALPEPTVINTATGQRVLPPPRDAIRDAMRKVRVYESPNWLLESIGSGYIPTSSELQALEDAYPSTYNQLRSKLEDRIFEAGGDLKLSSTERVKLARLFKLDTEEHQNPETAQFIQKTVYAEGNRQSEPQIKKPDSSKLSFVEEGQTDITRVTYGQ